MSSAGRRLANLTLDNLADLEDSARACVFWEVGPSGDTEGSADAKESWLADTLLQWGSCGQIAYVAGDPAAHAMYAPPAYVPGSNAFATAPVSADAVVLMSIRVRPEYVGSGLGRVLVQAVARDLVRRDVRAIEAFGHRRPGGTAQCLAPVGFLLSVGFKTVRPHPTTPRLRMDLKSTATWRADVESALERIMGTIHKPAPAVSARRR